MRSRAVCFVFIAATLLTTMFTTSSSAQWRGMRQPGQKVFRALGAGYGPGYHWRTPGANTDYYNPYSAHNSLLISQQAPQNDRGQYSNNGVPSAGIPFSAYAPTSGNPTNFGELPGAPINGTFQPIQPTENSESENPQDVEPGETDESNDWDDNDVTFRRPNINPTFRSTSYPNASSPKSSYPNASSPKSSYPKASYPKLNAPRSINENDWSLTDPFADTFKN